MQNTEADDRHKSADRTQTNRESTSLFQLADMFSALERGKWGENCNINGASLQTRTTRECSFFLSLSLSSRPPIHSIRSCCWMFSLRKSLIGGGGSLLSDWIRIDFSSLWEFLPMQDFPLSVSGCEPPSLTCHLPSRRSFSDVRRVELWENNTRGCLCGRRNKEIKK